MKFRVTGIIRASKYIGIIEAGSEEEAKELAYEHEEASISLCHHCSRDCEDPEIFDMEVYKIEDDEDE